MNLNRLIPSKPSQLGKYPDQAVLTAPVTISVGVPTESVSFWQSYGFFVVVIVWSVIYVFMAVWEFSTGYTVTTIDEILRNILGLWSLLAIPMLFLFLMIYWLHRAQKGFVVPNPWIARKWTWKHIPILIINKDNIQLTSQFYMANKNFQHDKVINYDDVEAFYLNQIRGSTVGFWIDYTEIYSRKMKNRGNRVQGLIFNKNIPLCARHNVLNGLYYIEQREILNIMNTFHKQRTDGIKYLSQDNHDNLMDIGW